MEWSEALSACRREVRRCQANLDAGGSRDFWIKRLTAAKKQAEECGAILGMQLAAMDKACPSAGCQLTLTQHADRGHTPANHVHLRGME